jgi:tetratricopeptide (TPR) repeat protein
MPTPRSTSKSPAASAPPRDALERLYVYWLASTVLILLALVGAALMLRGTLRQESDTVAALQTRVATLEQTVAGMAAARTAPPPAPAAPLAADVRPPPPDAPPTPPAAPELPDEQPPVPPPLSDAALNAELDAVLPPAVRRAADVRDPERGAALLQLASESVGRAPWTPASWLRLAVLARWLGHDAAAAQFARRGEVGGASQAAYLEASTRCLLEQGRAREALAFAGELVAQDDGVPAAPTLLAAALLATDDPGAADAALAAQPALEPLAPADRLLYAWLALALERWEDVDAALATVGSPSAADKPLFDFLTATALVRAGRTVAALAVLDGLLADMEAGTLAAGGRPDRYLLEVWRGVTLVRAQQLDAARQTLQAAAQRDPGRPEAHYQLGLLEARAGRPRIAESHLRNALASSARLAPAWEALAVLALGDDQLGPALQHAREAVKVDPRRAAGHFLVALAQARLGQAEAAGLALRRALQLDPTYLAEARHSEALTALFSPDEMQRWLAEPAGEPATSAPAAPR